MCVSAKKREIEENLDRSELWRFYEKAVEGRNAHYSQYIQFTNLYAIFTGALLVAFYHLIGNASYQPYAIIVAILGLSTSFLCFHKFMKDDVKSQYCLVKRKTSNDKIFNGFIIKSPSNEGEI